MVASPEPAPDQAVRDTPCYSKLDDLALVQQLRARDGRALEALYDRYSRLTFGLALRVLVRRDHAEEVVQDVFVKLWHEPLLFDSARGAFRGWLLRVVHNRAIDELRRNRRELAQSAIDPEGELWLGLPDPGPAPEESAFAALDREAVLQALGMLPPPQREAIHLAYYEGLTQTEIAARLGEPLGTIKTRVRLGMGRLRELLSSAGRGPEAR